jgi:hypothetical protein
MPDNQTPDLAELEALALAAGGERWRVNTRHPYVVEPEAWSSEAICTVQVSNQPNWPEISNFIAAANPAVILSLVERVRAAEERNEK